ncbi:MAG: type I 3-dehydroquinate dehydratase [Aquificae bacterium]|nr:type I 3-dehydroquinate dehydratase [Aquificota bacterium]
MERYPLVVLPVDDKGLEEKLKEAVKVGIDMVELRIDQFEDLSIPYIMEKAKQVKDSGLKLLSTVRCKGEGGADIPDEKRLEIFSKVSKVSDVIDIELKSEINREVVGIAKSNDAQALVSYHDFEKTPEEEEIQQIIDEAYYLGADIIKYAFKVNNHDDVARILCITNKNKGRKLVAIGMGELGKLTRVAGYFFGSIFTYTYIGKSFAPGQIEATKLIEELKFYGLRS